MNQIKESVYKRDFQYFIYVIYNTNDIYSRTHWQWNKEIWYIINKLINK